MIFGATKVGAVFAISTFFLFSLNGCSSSPKVKSQAYAQLSSRRTFEYSFPTVWKALEESLRKFKVVDRDPNEVDVVELKQLKRRSLKTDWIYSQSRDKYIEYAVNGSPRKTYLQTRYRYSIVAQKTLGGIDVNVNVDEEIEKLKNDGSSAGYDSVSDVDPTRASEFLDRLNQAVLAAPAI